MDNSKKIELSEKNILLIFKECLDASKQPFNRNKSFFFSEQNRNPPSCILIPKKFYLIMMKSITC